MTPGLVRAAIVAVLAAAAPPAGHSAPPKDEQARPLITGRRGMVVTLNPLSSVAGLRILMKGGNAFDAAVAAAVATTVVDPKNSSIGGQGFATVYVARNREDPAGPVAPAHSLPQQSTGLLPGWPRSAARRGLPPARPHRNAEGHRSQRSRRLLPGSDCALDRRVLRRPWGPALLRGPRFLRGQLGGAHLDDLPWIRRVQVGASQPGGEIRRRQAGAGMDHSPRESQGSRGEETRTDRTAVAPSSANVRGPQANEWRWRLDLLRKPSR